MALVRRRVGEQVGAVVASRRHAVVRRRQSTGFDGEVAKVYEKVFTQSASVWEECAEMTSKLCPVCATPRVLDVASGPGEPGLTIAKKMPHARVYVTDGAEAMIELAKKRSAGYENVTVALASADDLSAFDDESFDAITCSFGLMFFPDKLKALSEFKRVLKPGCEVIATHWDSFTVPELAATLVRRLDPDAQLDVDPLALSAKGAAEKLFVDAGFDVAEQRKSHVDFTFADPQEAFTAVTIPVRAKLQALAETDPDVFTKAKAIFHDTLVADYLNSHNTITLGPNHYTLSVAIKPPF